MVTIQIQIVNNELAEMGIEGNPTYTTFKFKDLLFKGYWIDSEGNTIMAYIDNDTFICQCTEENIKIFDGLLK